MKPWLLAIASLLLVACGGTSSTATSSRNDAGAAVCSSTGTSCADGQTIESCAVPGADGQCSSVYYELGSATFACASCTDFTDCARAATQACGGPGDAGLTTGDSQVGTSDAEDAGVGTDEAIDPIALGHTWTYAVTELGTYPACPTGASTATALMAGTRTHINTSNISCRPVKRRSPSAA